MRKIIGFLNSGMTGCMYVEAYLFNDTDTDEYIDSIIHQESVDRASSYMDIVSEHDVEEDDENGYFQGTDFEYESNIDGYWEDYNGDDHDGQRAGGGSFKEDFARLER